MRINPNLVPDILAAIQTTQEQEMTALEQLSSGKRVNRPSDDPAASSAMVRNYALAADADQYTKNASGLLDAMQTIDSSLSAVVTSVNQAISVGTEGANSTVTPAQRQALAQQVQSIFESVLNIGNLSFNGSYLFGGTATTAKPYAVDSTSPTGYRYTGNGNTNTAQIGAGFDLQTNLPGDQLFSHAGSDLLASLNQLALALQSGTTTEIGDAVQQVNTGLSYFTQQRVFYGNAMSQIKSQEDFLSQETVNLKSQENTLVGADPAQAATMLSQAQTANSAALSAAAKIMPQTLLDFLPTTL